MHRGDQRMGLWLLGASNDAHLAVLVPETQMKTLLLQAAAQSGSIFHWPTLLCHCLLHRTVHLTLTMCIPFFSLNPPLHVLAWAQSAQFLVVYLLLLCHMLCTCNVLFITDLEICCSRKMSCLLLLLLLLLLHMLCTCCNISSQT